MKNKQLKINPINCSSTGYYFVDEGSKATDSIYTTLASININGNRQNLIAFIV